MSYSEIITALISILAVSISVVSLRRTRKTNDRLVQLEEIHAKLSQVQLDEIEEKEKNKHKADVHADLVVINSDQYRLRVTSHGPGSAHQVIVKVAEDGEYDLLVPNDLESKVPYPILAPGKSFEIVALIPMQITNRVFPIVLSWEHDNGKKGYKECVVS